ncbi:MAG TPA: iron chelate uptake ABC transporter family permease subunit [Gordonia sp. (in: high G+C Gram-positive bacteria)]|uniref:FecCD family ABC transporter permease n=1 Tax=unclassified Gordonia (in: high G+C Gram-positive bacteria) TaxID=2657482 RepID=UPI0025C4266F|nr:MULTISPECIES: iron chelate uptake ABC transporter family permease subunit [unclassified Gordonia (in: high G+C Gram-positive bacteria)]HNP55383.1 iron chelate uptake ABC transporter family permease subunit [Gordonia sp. (in: high G+C Gram-positive bacteria)]HRC51541.1 iron chelate uptake ABC transporter family permease subunit [Gordonia sp. (in: high G+C Gram-positive bacteria)]
MSTTTSASSAIDFGRAQRVVRIARFSQRFDVRTAVVGAVVTVVLVVGFIGGLVAADDGVGLSELPALLAGNADPAADLAVRQWQLPRVLAAIVLGAAMGCSGGIFQLLTRNPLGSPDLIGFGVGSYTGALIAALVFGLGFAAMSGFALVGGLVTAGVVYLLAWRGGVGGFRLVITGVAISAMLASVNYWLILRSDLDEAMLAAQWGAGTLDTPVARDWSYLGPSFAVTAVLLVALALLSRRARIVDLGDELAMALGARSAITSIALPVVGVALIAVATTITGPVAFVALSAPHIARRLCRCGHTPWIVTALVGAALFLLGDIVAQRVSAAVGAALPVGVVTVCLGGIYLCYLLFTEMRRTRG